MDSEASRRVDIAVVGFGNGARLIQDFIPVSQTTDPVMLSVGGGATMGEGLDMAIDVLSDRNQLYDSMGTPAYRPWIFMISGSAPADDIERAAQRVRNEEHKNASGNLKFFALGAGNYDKASVFRLTNRVIALTDTDFDGIFNWIGESVLAISASTVDDNVRLGNLPGNAGVVQL
jgi:uncharacterized protein YegL